MHSLHLVWLNINLHYIKEIIISQSYYRNIIKNELTRLHVAIIMYNVFCQTLYMSIRTIHDFSIGIVRKFVFLSNRCVKPYVHLLITA